jgi:pyridoxine kinase
MAKVLAISSQVVWGPVGNTAAVPALQAEGHEVLQVPTILLSHHPRHGTPAVQRVSPDSFSALLESVEGTGALTDCAAVMTGYFADAAQVVTASNLIGRLTASNMKLMVLVDPVMGDNGALYVKEDIAKSIRDHLVPLATIITPNYFELSWLTSREISSCSAAEQAAAQWPMTEVLVTSIPVSDQQLGTLLLEDGTSHLIQSVKQPSVPHGTGDYLAGSYLAHRLSHTPPVAFRRALDHLNRVIDKSRGGQVLRNT